VAAGDLTRQGLLEAVTSLEAVDYEFMLPPGSGAFGADSPAGQAVLRTVFRMPESGFCDRRDIGGGLLRRRDRRDLRVRATVLRGLVARVDEPEVVPSTRRPAPVVRRPCVAAWRTSTQ
jgi:hypothetical protein